MANTTVELSRDEVFKAIYQYVEKNYPVKTTGANINVDRLGMVTGARVRCNLQKMEVDVKLTPKKL
jgi:hypothetical protein